jgi:hypothetical protein
MDFELRPELRALQVRARRFTGEKLAQGTSAQILAP